jgi:hypothetical protein
LKFQRLFSYYPLPLSQATPWLALSPECQHFSSIQDIVMPLSWMPDTYSLLSCTFFLNSNYLHSPHHSQFFTCYCSWFLPPQDPWSLPSFT